MNKQAALCPNCFDEFNVDIASRQRAEMMVEGYMFKYCSHFGVHCAFFVETGDTSCKFSASKDFAEMIDAAYIRARAFQRAQSIASERVKHATTKQ